MAEQRPVVLVRPESETMSKQRLPYFVGTSAVSAGATKLSMNMVVIPPGGAAEPHIHQGYETAIYIVRGRIVTHYGDRPRESLNSEAGGFLFIAPDVPHQPVNLSQTDAAIAIVAGNDPNERDSVMPDDLDGP